MCPLKIPGELPIESLWDQLEKHLQRYNQDIFDDLNPPANHTDITKLEESLGFSLPLEFVTFLKIHNGQRGQADWLFDGEEFLSTTSIFLNWRTLNSLRDQGGFDLFVPNSASEIRDSWWLPRWVPFTSNGAGDYTCLDLDPTPQGKAAQVINFYHDLDERSLAASSFTLWFQKFVNGIIN